MIEVLLIEDNPGDALLVQEMLFDAEGAPFQIHRAECLLDGLDQLAGFNPHVILLDLNLPDSTGIETFTTMKSHAPTTPIVLLTGHDSESLALAAVEAGAQDYLSKDKLEAEALARALRYAVIRHQSGKGTAPEAAEGGQVLGVMGAKGGVGTTTVACHLAAELRGQTGAEVLLADLNLLSGEVDFLMRTKSPYSIVDAANTVHRLDLDLWKSMVATSSAGVDVIGCPTTLASAEQTAGRFVHTIRFTRRHYGWTVADLGRLSPNSVHVLGELDRLFLVTNGDVLTVYETGRVIDALAHKEFPMDRLSIVFNESDKWASGRELLKSVLDIPIAATLPGCREELGEAYTKGRLVEEPARFRKDLAALAAGFTGVARKPDNNGFSLRRLFGNRELTAAESKT
ncbi:MAG: response regulator/pilus assembly protein [bacterium]|nr:response regulator/pilus assembly protein [bacterium]